jgi:GDP-4-dehydro-6-deoxy-D-mannose reductase
MRALITGIAGFAGSHLAEFLLAKKLEVFGFYLPKHSTRNVDAIKDKLHLIEVDLLKRDSVSKTIAEIKPDYVFHLAAFSSPARSFENPRETLENNIISQLNLLESLNKEKSKAKILIVGSSDEYGDVDKRHLSADEQTPLEPASPYAVSKVAQDFLGLQFFLHQKLNIVRVRPFNHIGPRQSQDFVVSAFASQIAKIEKAGEGEIKVGNLDSSRDFTDVRDMVQAYFLALEKCSFGEVYNIGTGKPVKISDILEKLISLSKVNVKVIQDKKLFRPVDLLKIYCDPTKFKKATGWLPKRPLLQTLSDTIEYERSRLK